MPKRCSAYHPTAASTARPCLRNASPCGHSHRSVHASARVRVSGMAAGYRLARSACRLHHRALRPTIHPQLLLSTVGLLVILAATGCAAGAAPASPAASAAPSAAGSPGAGPVDSAEAAAALVLAQDPAFAGIIPKDPDLIGQSSSYEVIPV